MKKVLFLLVIVAVCTSATPFIGRYTEVELRNDIDELIVSALEYGRWLLQRHQPLNVPGPPNIRIERDNMDILFSTDEAKLIKADDFTIDRVSNDVKTLHSSVAVTFPAVRLDGKYSISGYVANKSAEISGLCSAYIIKATPSAEIQFQIIKDNSLQIQELKLDYKVDDVKFDLKGYKIEGMAKEQMETIVGKEFLAIMTENREAILPKLSQQLMRHFNPILMGHTLQDVIDFLKKMVASTPDPPPF